MAKLASKQYGEAAAATVRAWRAMIEETRALPDHIKLRHANDFINGRIRFESDLAVWRQADYWATPLELFGKQAGDCEDFAITKYVTLRAQGIPAEKLRLVYVHARIGAGNPGQAHHMVLSYYETPAAEPLILDSLVGEILPAGRRSDLFPIFSFNHEGPRAREAARSSADATARLSRWRGVLARMRGEGLDLS
ncbi:MAG: transglutaminase-like cysteine peptidase [Azoarcus sp.]|jgi:predicted transglutaminase-like cysteine proteinase|nr:transglutaminase-like cysteine peptidase [Azoarcus sp.]